MNTQLYGMEKGNILRLHVFISLPLFFSSFFSGNLNAKNQAMLYNLRQEIISDRTLTLMLCVIT